MTTKRRKPDQDYSSTSTPQSGPSSGGEGTDPIGSIASYSPLGRLDSVRMTLGQDPRLDARLLGVLTKYGLDRKRTKRHLSTLSSDSSPEDIQRCLKDMDHDIVALCSHLPNALPNDDLELETETRILTIPGPDSRTIDLYIYQPVLQGRAPLPTILHCPGTNTLAHLPPTNKIYTRWCRSLATQGLIVLSLDYHHHHHHQNEPHTSVFPEGLNNLCAAIHYIHSHRAEFNARNLVLQGDSLGGTLVLSAAIRAKREGWANKIDGVYAHSPMLSNAYTWTEERKARVFPSLIECDGYVVDVEYMSYAARLYSPQSADAVNALAWPHYASRESLTGLPPHVISLDELSPLRSEGEVYLRKLVQAGVQATGHVTLGAVHVASVVFRQAAPALHRAAVRGVAGFAKQV
ncbi:hypothetical protein LTR62_003212 [Meristemomyces frigidus]|uniref:Alpha/beta hydrolase fold-3 domain-containing protein n=1 Tax=Meristemomyces frigidus TaxID=1508187 RepID=A0AAN7TJ15_9PEZI|nr:hypothetical protein LTR62_003212 [Meristemomyces frigidus]